MSGGDGPCARTDDLIAEPIGDELLIYDELRHRAHSLNLTAAAVFQACDGTRSREQIAEECSLDIAAVDLALTDLAKSNLLLEYTGPREGVSRRTVIRRLAVVGAGVGVAVPVIRSITAPTAALASPVGGKSSVNARNAFYCNASAPCSAGSDCYPASPGSSAGFCYRPPGASCYYVSPGNQTSADYPSQCYANSSTDTRCPSNGVCPPGS
jgi:hypothetical protein